MLGLPVSVLVVDYEKAEAAVLVVGGSAGTGHCSTCNRDPTAGRRLWRGGTEWCAELLPIRLAPCSLAAPVSDWTRWRRLSLVLAGLEGALVVLLPLEKESEVGGGWWLACGGAAPLS